MYLTVAERDVNTRNGTLRTSGSDGGFPSFSSQHEILSAENSQPDRRLPYDTVMQDTTVMTDGANGADHEPEVPTEKLRITIQRLHADGHLTEDQAERMQRDLPTTLHSSAYVLRHLTAHWAIGAVFAFDIVPLPLGTMARVCWVIGSRVVETCCGRWDRAAVHSLPVLGMAAIPVAGYFAYLIPLQSRSADAAFLYANHFTYTRSNCALSVYLERKPRWIRWMVQKAVAGPKEPNEGDQVPGKIGNEKIGIGNGP